MVNIIKIAQINNVNISDFTAIHNVNIMIISYLQGGKIPDHEEDEKMTNKRLEKLQPLRHRVAIYVPGTNGVNTAADNARYVKMAAAALSNLFGGATATPAIGYWMSDAAGLVEEKTTVVYAYAAGADLERGLDTVIDFCADMRADLQQEAVSLEIDGSLYFI